MQKPYEIRIKNRISEVNQKMNDDSISHEEYVELEHQYEKLELWIEIIESNK